MLITSNSATIPLSPPVNNHSVANQTLIFSALCRIPQLMERMRFAEDGARPPLDTLTWRIESHQPNYRNLPIEQGFNWPKLLREVSDYLGYQQDNYYLVVFRSTRWPGEDNASLIESLDTAAFTEAKTRKPDALLHYFAGQVDEEGRALSWCLWTDRESAREALSGPAHRQAAHAARNLYESYGVEGFNVYPGLDDESIVFEPTLRQTPDKLASQ